MKNNEVLMHGWVTLVYGEQMADFLETELAFTGVLKDGETVTAEWLDRTAKQIGDRLYDKLEDNSAYEGLLDVVIAPTKWEKDGKVRYVNKNNKPAKKHRPSHLRLV